MGKSITTSAAVFAAAALLAFVGGYGMGHWTTAAEEAPTDGTADDPQAAGTASGAAARSESLYVPVGQIIVPLLKGGRTEAFIMTQVTMEAVGQEAAHGMRRRLPQLRNAVLQSLFGLAGDGFFDGPSIEPAEAGRAIRKAVNDQFGEELVRQVLIDRLMRQDNRRL